MKTYLVILLVLCGSCHLLLGAESAYADLSREQLGSELKRCLLIGDHVAVERIREFYTAERSEWLSDAEPYFISLYQEIRTFFGADQESDLDYFRFGPGLGVVASYARSVESPALLALINEDFAKAQDYTFPPEVIMNGWPQPGDSHQLKGIKGQLLSVLISKADSDAIGAFLKQAKGFPKDSNGRLLIIWGLGYTADNKAIAFLKELALGEVKREAVLSQNALNRVLNCLSGENDIDPLDVGFKEDEHLDNIIRPELTRNAPLIVELARFLSENKMRRTVSAGQYYPDQFTAKLRKQ